MQIKLMLLLLICYALFSQYIFDWKANCTSSAKIYLFLAKPNSNLLLRVSFLQAKNIEWLLRQLSRKKHTHYMELKVQNINYDELLL